MPRGAPGADSNDIVTSHAHGKTLLDLARDFLGQEAVFWGRYFKGVGNTDPAQYQAAQENSILNARNIRVLATGRQTNHVGRDEATGAADAQHNVDAVLDAFGKEHLAQQGGEFYLFLDTEPGNPLSQDYYRGWATTVVARSRSQTGNNVTLLPCVYLNQGDAATCRAIRHNLDAGVPCHGLWTARYFNHDHSGCHLPVDFDPTRAVPDNSPACPTLIWQYVGDCFGPSADNGPIDGNQLNPDHEAETLARLILPPA